MDRDGLRGLTSKSMLAIGLANKGKIISQETREKLRQINLGRKHTDEHKAAIGAAHKSQKRSDETKERMSRTRTGMRCSEETRQKLSEALSGRKLSPEHIAAMTAARTANPPFAGRKHTPEAREKMRQANLASIARKAELHNRELDN